MDSSGDFLDEDGGQSVRSELFMDAEEVDFGGFELQLVGVDVDGDTGDETDELLGFYDSDTWGVRYREGYIPMCQSLQ